MKALKSTSTSPVGYSGVLPTLGIALASVLDVAEPDETILVVSAVDGCDALLLRTTDQLPQARQSRPVGAQLRRGHRGAAPDLSCRGTGWSNWSRPDAPNRTGPPRRPPRAARSGSSDSPEHAAVNCDFVHLPPVRVCRSCGTTDEMDAAPVADLGGTIVTHTVDHLAYSPSPPMIQAVLDVDGGGRCTIEVTDAEPERLRVGARVAFTFRRLFTSGGVHDYFWKSHLLDTGSEDDG